MNILFFSSYFYPYVSGLTVYPLRILKHLAKKNNITVLTFGNPSTTLSIGQQLTIKYIPYLFKISKGFYSPFAKFYFLKYLLKNDIVILNLPCVESLGLAILAKLFGKKLISIFHCQVTLPFSPINQLIRVFLKVITNIQLSLSDQIITNTKDYFDSLNLIKEFGEKTSYIFPPIELKKLNKQEFKRFASFKKDRIWIGYLGRISAEKGIEYLIDAVKTLKNKRIELVFAGQNQAIGENDYYKFIKEKLAANKIKYRFFNKLKENQLAAFYKSLDIYALPSINPTESFGMAQAEAMTVGTPAITSNLPGVRVPLGLTKMGILVDPKNSQQISQAILKIIANRQKYSNEKLMKRAKKIFSADVVYEFYENLITISRL